MFASFLLRSTRASLPLGPLRLASSSALGHLRHLKLPSSPRPPLGLVDFVGFADTPLVSAGANSPMMNPASQHACFTPRIEVSCELPELMGALLDESLGGTLHLTWNCEGVAVEMAPPEFYLDPPPPLSSASPATDADELYFRPATEAQLDQVVVRAATLKLRSPNGDYAPAGVYRAPRDGTFWLRDFWSAVEDYERRLLPTGELFERLALPSDDPKDFDTDRMYYEGVGLDEGTGVVFLSWGS